MHVRPNTIILCDGGTLRTWAPRDKGLVPLNNEDSQLLCSLQFGHCSELPPEAAARLTELGALASDTDYFDYPPYPIRSRSYQAAEHGLENVANTLCISDRTQLRFLADAVYAWSPTALIKRLRQRYDRYLLLTPPAAAVLLSFATPSTPQAARSNLASDSLSEQEFLRHVQALKDEGLLHGDSPRKTRKPGAFFGQVRQPETAAPVLHEEVNNASDSGAGLGESTSRLMANAFLVLVYYVLVVPLGWMQRIRPASRRAQRQRSESTWESCQTQGLRDKNNYKLPF